jgi:hypothetical protein
MNPREIRKTVDRMDAGRRDATKLLQQIDVGIDPIAAILDIRPGLSKVSVDAARQLAGLAAFHYAALGLVLTGMVPDSALESAEIEEPPVQRVRKSPEELAAAWLLTYGAPAYRV